MRRLALWGSLCVLLGAAGSTRAAVEEAPWPTFTVGDRTAIALMGPAELRDDLAYVTFAGDLGFRSNEVLPDDLERFAQSDAALLAHFSLRSVNLEFLPAGDPEPRALVDAVLDAGGFEVVALANNHALDHGQAALDAEVAHLENGGHSIIGTPSNPVYWWDTPAGRTAIYALTHYTDTEPDSDAADAGVLLIEPEDLERVRRAAQGADLRIAFIHLGSLSRFPSPHEIELVESVIETGADLVVCSGAHFVKGFREIQGVPVLFGTGNHLFSYKGPNTEPVGMHVVAGVGASGIEQIVAIPFGADWVNGPYGPLDASSTNDFARELALRSDPDAGDYFSDDRTADLFWNSLRKLNLEKFQRLRPRHFAYAARILFARYPWVAWPSVILIIVGGVGLAVRTRRRRGRSG